MQNEERNPTNDDPHVILYAGYSVFVASNSENIVFREGPPNALARDRLANITSAFESGYLENLIGKLRTQQCIPRPIDQRYLKIIETLVDSVTSEVGRALIGLSILQLAIKHIAPEQNIRLHKGGRGQFSWEDGIPMRSIDQRYVTPTLRKHDLLKLNSYGFMMTRSLAENYPYTALYKAAIRGAKEAWLELVDVIEQDSILAEPLLETMIATLINKSDHVRSIAEDVLHKTNAFISGEPEATQIFNLIQTHITSSNYSARLLEVAMHSLMQVLDSHGDLPGKLIPLSQMRSANKKHGNVADIEIQEDDSFGNIIEAWDAKFGKPYLRDELDELVDKLETNPGVKIVGFVLDREPEIDPELEARLMDINTMFNVEVRIVTLKEWVNEQMLRTAIEQNSISAEWLLAYAESLALKRRELAPIDEPVDNWLQELAVCLERP